MNDDQIEEVRVMMHAIINGEYDDALAQIEWAVKQRMPAALRAGGISVGARIVVTSDTTHQTAGQHGIVLRVNRKTATVRLDNGKEWRIPPGMLSPEVAEVTA